MRNVYAGQADALINVPGNDLCVIPVTLFIRIRYDTWHMIHQQSTMTFTILMSSFSLRVSGFMPSVLPHKSQAYMSVLISRHFIYFCEYFP